MFIGDNKWESEYKATVEAQTVKYILADRFDSIFLQDLKESFENCLRVDSGNSLTKPFNFNNMRGLNLAEPVNDSDATNKKYVNNAIYRFEAVKVEENPISGEYKFAEYKNGVTQYSLEQGGGITFVLPEPEKINTVNQIMVDIKTDAEGSEINVGTDQFFDKTAVSFAANSFYTIIWEYSNRLGAWVCGMLSKGAVI